jgi:hypothetical protein
MDHRRSMADTSGQTYEEPLLAGWAARGWGMGGGTWAMKACLPAMVLLRAVEGGERRACRVVVEVAVGNALPASSGRVALTTLRDGPPAGRSGRRRPWAGRTATSAVGGRLFGWFFLRLGFLLEGDERPSVSVSVFRSGCSGCPLSHVLLLRSFPRTRPLLPIPNCPPPIGRPRPMLRRTASHLIHHPYHIIASSDNHHIAPLAPPAPPPLLISNSAELML